MAPPGAVIAESPMLSRVATPSAGRVPAGSLWTQLSGPEALRTRLPASALACIGFGVDPGVTDDPRLIYVGLPQLAPSQRFEVWHSETPVRWDRDGVIGFAHDGEVLMGHLFLLECELEQMAAATFRAYAQIAAFLDRQGYPSLLRCWNYLHDINRGDADRERYKQFCLGRFQALSAAPGFERQLPAGTAIGMAEPGLAIYFLASKAPGLQVENPRQVPAFHYPRQYGPRSPSFSRATFTAANGVAKLLVSGTASVIGHATRHPGNAAAQLDETLANIRALLQHAATTHLGGGDGTRWSPQTLRVYLRDRRDYDFARARLEQVLGREAPVLYVEGAICRSDLHVEIEGVYTAPRA